MKKNESTPSIYMINREISRHDLANAGDGEQTPGGRLARALTVFGVIRPLLLILTTFPFLPPASRSAVSVFVQSLDAVSVLAVPGDTDEVADFKAGRDL